MTPAAVGRGEREVSHLTRRLADALCAQHSRGAISPCVRCKDEAAHIAQGFVDALRATAAALPPDAGGEDGEREAEVRGGMKALEDAALALERMRGTIRGDEVAHYTEWLRGRAQILADAARRSATERKGGGN